MERLYTLGIDLAGMEGATKVLCDDLDGQRTTRLFAACRLIDLLIYLLID